MNDSLANNLQKWDRYYELAENGQAPPWESPHIFEPLKIWLDSFLPMDMRNSIHVIELGCGSSASAIWMANAGFNVTAIDISEKALRRAQLIPGSDKVNWICGDLLTPQV